MGSIIFVASLELRARVTFARERGLPVSNLAKHLTAEVGGDVVVCYYANRCAERDARAARTCHHGCLSYYSCHSCSWLMKHEGLANDFARQPPLFPEPWLW